MASTPPDASDRFKQLLAEAAAPVQREAEDPQRVAAFRELQQLCAELEQIAEVVPIAQVVPDMQDKLDRLTRLVEQTGGITPLPVHFSDQLDIALIRMRHGKWLVTTTDLARVKAHFLKWHAPQADRVKPGFPMRLWQRLAFRLTHKYPPYYEAYRQKWQTCLPADPAMARHPGPTFRHPRQTPPTSV